MVSMKDIAAKCGVSVATVSKALNGHSDISDETKKLIGDTAKAMGYFPNSSARALKTKRTYNLGVLFVDQAQSGLTHDYFAHVLDSFKKYAESSGYDITFINAERQNNMSYLEHSRYRGVDGVVIACVDFDDQNVIDLINSDLPVVTIDHVFNNRTSVVSDNISGMRDLVNYVYEQGHRKIAYIYGDNTSVTQNRVASFCNTLKTLGIDLPDAYLQESSYRNPVKAGELTKKLMKMKNRPTCIIYPDDYSCIGGIAAIRDMGLSVPGDISVAGYDGLYVSQILNPKLTTVEQDTTEIGRIAAEELIKLIEDPRTTLIDKFTVSGKVIAGGSVGGQAS